MAIPSISELEFAASKIVWNARKKGNLKSVVPDVYSSLERLNGFEIENIHLG